jgi:hypothetical protein
VFRSYKQTVEKKFKLQCCGYKKRKEARHLQILSLLVKRILVELLSWW